MIYAVMVHGTCTLWLPEEHVIGFQKTRRRYLSVLSVNVILDGLCELSTVSVALRHLLVGKDHHVYRSRNHRSWYVLFATSPFDLDSGRKLTRSW